MYVLDSHLSTSGGASSSKMLVNAQRQVNFVSTKQPSSCHATGAVVTTSTKATTVKTTATTQCKFCGDWELDPARNPLSWRAYRAARAEELTEKYGYPRELFRRYFSAFLLQAECPPHLA